jgi:abequosyltransferase
VELSFCIPVFNFGDFLPETLQSVLEQLPEDAEIVVLDGGSTDGTESFMRAAVASNPRVRYIRQDAPGGIDNDLAASIQCAKGRFCWLLSGDDTLRPGAVRKVVECLSGNPDLVLLAHTNCSSTMKYIGDHPVLDVDQDWRVDLGVDSDRRRWLSKARTTEALFSFMSTLVIRRELWIAQPSQPEFNGSCWAHVARLMEAARRRLDVAFIPEPLVNRRGENDSFRGRGIVRRLAISVDGFDHLARRFARNQEERAEIMRLVRADLPIRFFLGAKGACRRQPERESRLELDRIVVMAYGGSGFANQLRLWLYRIFPAWLEPPARAVLDHIRRWSSP